MLNSGSAIASRYRILRELGRGGMGVVYLVEHVHTGDHLALKLLLGNAALNARAVERFKREARASARIKSDNIVKVVDADTAPELQGAPFLVMELLNGSDLQKQLEKHGRFAPGDALKYLSEAARALDKSHAMGIVHRDLKPENLFLHTREDGTTLLKILDFGISKVIGSPSGNDMAGAGMTNTGAVMGTPLYMSPEQARGRVADIGPATDVWAMGLISLQLLTGEIYWQANTIGELMVQILSEPFYQPTKRWPWLPHAIDGWFAQSCARDHSMRFPSVGAQIEALGVALGLRTSASAHLQPRALMASAPSRGELPPANAPTPPAARIAGAQTTTGAVSGGDIAAESRHRGRTIAGAAVILLAMAAGAVGIGRAQMQVAAAPMAARSFASGWAATLTSASAATAGASGIDAGTFLSAMPSASSTAAAPDPSPSARVPSGRKWGGPNVPPAPSNDVAVPGPGPKKPFAPAGL